jgi:Ca-activated chloride channel homolog
MTERELASLKSLPVPPPGEVARSRALAAALTTFDAQVANAGSATQGTGEAVRPTSKSDPRTRRRLMPTIRSSYAMAASVAALAVAVPALLLVMGPQLVRMDRRDTLDKDVGRSAPITPPLIVDRKEMAARGADPAAAHVPLSPSDGLGADGRSGAPAPATVVGKPAPGPEDSVLLAKPKGEAAAIATAGRIAESGATVTAGERATIAPPASAPAKQAEHALAGLPAPSGLGHKGDARFAAETGFTDKIAQGPVAIESDRARRSDRQIAATLPPPEPAPAQVEEHRDQHATFDDNGVKQVATEPVSTFSIDVDTASYSFARRALNTGRLPQKAAVRVEEMINYFPYAYPAPESADVPFAPAVQIFPAPWNAAHKLVHIGIKGYTLQAAERPRANLVFLIDVSGSMSPEDRLPLVKNAFRLLVDQLKPDDTVGIVTYASGTGIALKPTKAANKGEILAAIDRLGAGGSTAGAQGIQDAYALAEAGFDPGGVNRIILATDGDFNVGITNREELKSFVERKREKGIFLSILGVGIGNYNDQMMQTLAQNGNGVAAYVDTLNEARKVLVEEASSSLFTIAKDVKIQVEFNPAAVSEYRLIGYETRALKRDVGSGHTVTAIYEITPVGSEAVSVDPLRYGPTSEGRRRIEPANEFGFLKLRYKLPKEDASKLLTMPLTTALEKKSIADATTDARFSVAVAGYGQLLRGSPHLKGFGYDDVIALAQGAKGDDPFGYRSEFINLTRIAKSARQ